MARGVGVRADGMPGAEARGGELSCVAQDAEWTTR